MTKFKQGHIVKLMSGGPLMTVILTAECPDMPCVRGASDPVKVAWVNSSDELQEAFFDSSALKRG